jgi:hypothetical protein
LIRVVIALSSEIRLSVFSFRKTRLRKLTVIRFLLFPGTGAASLGRT